jgi:hypothetical protein
MNLYVFSIGGSGVRVLHSLTMLLAAGVKMKSEKVIPVIIDTDETNGNTTTMLAAINNYRKVYDRTKKEKGTSIFATEIDDPKIITISGTKFGNLKGIVGESAVGIDESLKALLGTIYSEENLDMPLTYGFIGNPNVGSVVLSYLFQKNELFRNTVKGIDKDDKIFLISSIFGGTGAAGFPLLLNIFNHSTETGLNRKNHLKGALSLVPYYQVGNMSNNIGNNILDAEDNNGQKVYSVDSALFDSKTFAAQLYYDRYIDGDITAMYYVGDEKTKSTYANYMGGENQNNPAHAVELMGALSISHFDNQELKKENSKDGATKDAQYANLIFSSDDAKLTAGGNEELRNALIRLWMFRRFFMNYLPNIYLKNNPPVLQQINYNENNYTENGKDTFSVNMKAFLEAYKKWTEDLEDKKFHNRTFEFTDTKLNPEDELIHSGFTGYKPKEVKGLFGKKIEQSDFLGSLNKLALSATATNNSDFHSRLTYFASQVIDDIINHKMH